MAHRVRYQIRKLILGHQKARKERSLTASHQLLRLAEEPCQALGDKLIICVSAKIRVKHFRKQTLMVDYVPGLSDPEARAIVELSEKD